MDMQHAFRRGVGEVDAGVDVKRDLAQFAVVNKVMAEVFAEPYPARVTIGVASLPRGVGIEVDCVLVL